MTLAAQMVSDVTDVFLNTDEHAETITYTPLGGSPVSRSAIVDRLESVRPDTYPDGKMRKMACTIIMASDSTNGVATVTEGDSVTISSKTWKVAGRPILDGYGMQTIELERDEVVDKDANDRTWIKR